MEADNEVQRSKLEKFRDELSQEFSALRATYSEVSGSKVNIKNKLYKLTISPPPPALKKETLPIPTPRHVMNKYLTLTRDTCHECTAKRCQKFQRTTLVFIGLHRIHVFPDFVSFVFFL